MATALVTPAFIGCDDDPMRVDAGGGLDAGGALDAGGGVDAGPAEFPVRDIPAPAPLNSLIADIGPLGDPDAEGLRLPAGFTGRKLATSGEMVAGTDYEWHQAPDGGATFATEDGGWIYVCNSEVPIIGGVGAMRFDASGSLVDAYRTLERSNINCAGGPTPWHTWLSCEERAQGLVFETDPWGEVSAIERPALGVFKHEAVCVDPERWHLYLSEDEGDGGFYRFRPAGMNAAGFPDLTAGALEIAEVAADGAVTWHEVPDPSNTSGTSVRNQVAAATRFDGGEGIWYHDGVVYLSTKGDTRVWAYDVVAQSIAVLYDGEAIMDPPLTGVDNVVVSCCGDVLVAEDGGSMQIVAILPSGELKPLVQVTGQDDSEITGPAFDPSGTRLYFNSQRGTTGSGFTYEITGPFHEPA